MPERSARRAFSRRSFVAYVTAASLSLFAGEVQGQAAIDAAVHEYMQEFDIPGLSIAYGRGARIFFAQSYGWADRGKRNPVSTSSLFRIASCSKPITSAAIYTLVQTGKLRTSDKVFGPQGILPHFRLGKDAGQVQQITVEHLLTHTSGGWANGPGDPMFHTSEHDHGAFLQHTLDTHPLTTPPGTEAAYSNFGYFVLGRVVEQVAGQSYEDFTREKVLAPLGVHDMRLGMRKAAPNEVHYYGQGKRDPYDIPIELHDANGGWLATASDLVRFALGVFSAADNAGAPALLSATTLAQMTQVLPPNPKYASGWSVLPRHDFSHSGGFDGSASYLVHRHDGIAWAVVVNTRQSEPPLERDLHQLSWQIADQLQA